MAINNFESIVIDGSGALVAQGLTLTAPLPAGHKVLITQGAKIEVVVISCDPREGKRCDPTVADPTAGSWPAIAPDGAHPFHDGDVVYVMGAADAPHEPLFVWCQKFAIGHGPVT